MEPFPLPRTLTEEQRQAITAPDPLLCVLAGAGAGKTRVLTLRVARRVDDGSAFPERVLVCTFSRKAAGELRSRLWDLGVGGGITAGTIHRTALSLLRQHREDRGLPPPAVTSNRRTLLSAVLAEGGPGPGGRGPRASPATQAQLDGEIGWSKATMVRPQDYERAAARAQRRAGSLDPATVAAWYQRYEEERRRRGLLDLDDLLTTCADVLSTDGPFADAVHWRFRHLFVDEMQDVNPAQFRFLTTLLGDEPDLFVVGDPHQSVYGWNGADPSLLQRLPDILPGTRTIRLTENHRSSPQVVVAANAALGLRSDAPRSAREDGTLPTVTAHDDDEEEARWVARQVWRAHGPGRRWDRIAVLARTNRQLEAVATALQRERVPFHIAGLDLAPASDVAEPRAEEARRGEQGAPGDAEDKSQRNPRSRPPEQADGERRPEGTAADGADLDDAVVLSTFHRAKGLQWATVFVIGLSEGLLPISSARTDAAVAEERRLLYVAMTRAEENLSCSWARWPGPSPSPSPEGREARRPSRSPCRWLREVEATIGRLARTDAAATPNAAAELAAIRARLAAQAETETETEAAR